MSRGPLLFAGWASLLRGSCEHVRASLFGGRGIWYVRAGVATRAPSVAPAHSDGCCNCPFEPYVPTAQPLSLLFWPSFAGVPTQERNIIYSVIARDTVILVEETLNKQGRKIAGNFATITNKLLPRFPATDGKSSFIYDQCVALVLLPCTRRVVVRPISSSAL